MSILYGYTKTFDGTTCNVSGCSSEEEAKQIVYEMGLKTGWKPDPLKEKWWQFWRPKTYPEPLMNALKKVEQCSND